jgi:hypothetical protein
MIDDNIINQSGLPIEEPRDIWRNAASNSCRPASIDQIQQIARTFINKRLHKKEN